MESILNTRDGDELGLVYFRSGYTASDFKNSNDWDARLLIEESLAIKSPNILNQLTGAKSVQQALCDPNVIQKFIEDKTVSEKLQSTFVDQFCFKVIFDSSYKEELICILIQFLKGRKF